MSVYVGRMYTYSKTMAKKSSISWGCSWCIMYSDAEDYRLLHEIAKKIGIPRIFFYGWSNTPHYKLSFKMRENAIKNGAIDITHGKEKE